MNIKNTVISAEYMLDSYTARWRNFSTFAAEAPTSDYVYKKGGLHFNGWYDSPDFSGTPISFPYFSNDKTVLYAK